MGEHRVARIGGAVTSAHRHERADAVAVPDARHLEQTFTTIAAGLTSDREPADRQARRSPSARAKPVAAERQPQK
jgi:hypothetical protein